MKEPLEHLHPSQFVDELRQRQRNNTWPDSMRNGRNVDAFLWHGSENPKPIQRVGAAIFGLFFFVSGVGSISVGYERGAVLCYIVGACMAGLGCKVLSNCFAKNPRKPRSNKHIE